MEAMEAMDPNERAKVIDTMSYKERMALAIEQSAREAAERAAAERAAREHAMFVQGHEVRSERTREAAAHAVREHAMFVQGHEVRSEADRSAVVERAFGVFTAAEGDTRRSDEMSRRLEEALEENKQLERANDRLRQQLDNAKKLIDSLLVSGPPLT